MPRKRAEPFCYLTKPTRSLGKRSEVHRSATTATRIFEISYLLQRMDKITANRHSHHQYRAPRSMEGSCAASASWCRFPFSRRCLARADLAAHFPAATPLRALEVDVGATQCIRQHDPQPSQCTQRHWRPRRGCEVRAGPRSCSSAPRVPPGVGKATRRRPKQGVGYGPAKFLGPPQARQAKQRTTEATSTSPQNGLHFHIGRIKLEGYSTGEREK